MRIAYHDTIDEKLVERCKACKLSKYYMLNNTDGSYACTYYATPCDMVEECDFISVDKVQIGSLLKSE